jgi:hypothetical protein
VHREEVARRIWQEVAQHPSPVPVGQDGKG